MQEPLLREAFSSYLSVSKNPVKSTHAEHPISVPDYAQQLRPSINVELVGGLVVLGRNNPSLYTVNGRPLYVHLNGLAIVLLK
jgi:hypothetical protein